MSDEQGPLEVVSLNWQRRTRPSFESYREVAAYLGRRVSEAFMIVKPFQPEVVGGLVVADSVECLRLVGGQKVGTVRRSISGVYPRGVTVSTAPRAGVDVVAHVEPMNSRLLDRGLAWIHVFDEGAPLYKVCVDSEHGIEEEEVAERLTMAEARTVQMVKAILESDTEPPFAWEFITEEV